MKWKTILALTAIAFSMIMDWYWIWGIIFLYWVIGDIKSGVSFIVEPIYKEVNPILYWIVVLLWSISGIYTLSYILL